ncbi:MAG: RyR domain-containing protein [candidate division WOR-3 bacterium]
MRLVEWPAVGALGLISLGLGTLGYFVYAPRCAGEAFVAHLLDSLYRSLQLIALEFCWEEPGVAVPWPLQVARFALPPLAGWTALRALYALFREQAQLLKIWLVYRRHIIVCGLGQKGLALVRDLRGRGERVVVVELDAENDFIQPCRDAGAIVLVGDATTAQTLERAGIARARLLVAVTPQDSTNVEIADLARNIKLRPGCRQTLTCIIQLLDPRFCRNLQGWALAERSTGRFRLELFNIYRDGARRLCRESQPFADSVSVPHVVVVGTGRMATAVVEQVAREWLGRERQRHATEKVEVPFRDWLSRFRMTLAGPGASAAAGLLLAQHGWLAECCDLIGRDVAVPSAEFERGVFLPGEDEVCCAFVCLEDGEASFVAGTTLVGLLSGRKARVVAVVEREVGIALCGAECAEGSFPSVFPLLERTCDATLVERGVVETVARALHEQWCSRAVEADRAAPTWQEAPEYMRDSSRAAVGSYRDLLTELGFELRPLADPQHTDGTLSSAEIEEIARREHERWAEERRAEGWTLGERYDDDRKTSPWLRTWNDSGYAETNKDYDRKQVVKLPAMLAGADIEIRRNRWVLFGRELAQDCLQNHGQAACPMPVGPEPEKEWIDRAGVIVGALMSHGYRVEALPKGGVRVISLPADIERDFDAEGGVCRALDPGFDRLDDRLQQTRRAAASRIPAILARLGFEIRPDRQERLAIALHVHYCRTRRAAGDTQATNPSLVPWRELPEYKRESNRLAARDVERKLRAVGCHVRDRRGDEPLFVFEAEEVELIARMEHERWLAEKQSQGWKYGPTRSDIEKTNPYMRSWEELSAAERRNDLDTARDLPTLLAGVGQQIERDERDVIGRQIHEEYLRSQREKGDTPDENPSLVPWYRLPPHLRESNRRQADDIRRKLESIGCRIVPAAEAADEKFEFTSDELERLAKEEHDRWVREREADGWRFAPKKDVQRKLSPYLVPWEQLAEDIRDNDRNAVRAIPVVLAAAGLAVRRK